MNKTAGIVMLAVTVAVLLRYVWYRAPPRETAWNILADIDIPDVTSNSAEDYGPPQIINITSNVFVAFGYAFSTVTMIVGDDGVMIIDTTESMASANVIANDFRKISSKPVKVILYTHHHADHTNGAKAFRTKGHVLPEVWAHHSMSKEEQIMWAVGPAYLRRGSYQFGTLIPEELRHKVFAGTSKLGDVLSVRGFRTSGKRKPTKFLQFDDQLPVTVAGLNLTIVHIPGETSDQVGVWYPAERVLVAADDIHKAFPNLYAIRGTVQRDVNDWVASLNRMRQLRPARLVLGHSMPLCGEETIDHILSDYSTAIQFVHDQTVRYINKGIHPFEIVRLIDLPKELKENPFLEPLYGTVPWSVRGVYDMYIGWFSGDALDLNPLTPDEKAERMVGLLGTQNILNAAEEALDSEDYQWALELASFVFRYDTSNNDAMLLRREALRNLAALQTSGNGRHYLMSAILKDANLLPEASNEQALLYAPTEVVFQSLRYKLNAEILPEGFQLEGCFHLSDTDVTKCVQIHSGVLQVVSDKDLTRISFKAKLTEKSFRAILAHLRTPEEIDDIEVTDINALKQFISCLDK